MMRPVLTPHSLKEIIILALLLLVVSYMAADPECALGMSQCHGAITPPDQILNHCDLCHVVLSPSQVMALALLVLVCSLIVIHIRYFSVPLTPLLHPPKTA